MLIAKIGTLGKKIFSPKNLSNLVLWLDASDETSVKRNGDVVYQWNDLSGLDNHATQSIEAGKPTYDIVNRRLLFDGINNSFIIPNVFTFNSSGMAIVFNNRGANSFNASLLRNNGLGSSKSRLYMDGSSVDFGDTTLKGLDILNQKVINIGYVEGINNTTQHFLQNNNVELIGNVTRYVLSNQFRIGSYGNGLTDFYQGDIFEIIAWNGEITPENVSNIKNYLNAKWGVY